MEKLLSDLCIPSPLQELQHRDFDHAGVRLWIKRDDLIHPILSGNKWRKMAPLLEIAMGADARELLGIGGAYSNLLHALAYAGYRLGIRTRGMVRGSYARRENPTLKDCRNWGMQIECVPRKDFIALREQDISGMREDGVFYIPLGGTDKKYLQQVGVLMDEVYERVPSMDFACVPVGSGGTMAGMINASGGATKVLGFSSFKQDFEREMVAKLLPGSPSTQWEIIKGYPKAGFGKIDARILAFIKQFYKRWNIKLDAVYNGKMMFVLLQMIRNGYFPRGSDIVAVHSGGTQGLRALPDVFN